jgi:peptide chain release factor 2
MAQPDFWDRREAAQETVTEVSRLKGILEPFSRVESEFGNLAVLLELAEIEGEESELLLEADESWSHLQEELDKLELVSFLSGKMDSNNAILAVHAGAGGTESCDWASMLIRMYTHWLDKRGFDYQIIDMQPGDEAGTKSATLIVSGECAYGYLKAEKGVHRLVRISPFDANAIPPSQPSMSCPKSMTISISKSMKET